MLSISALLQRATIDDHEEILKSCNALLKQSKGDVEAQRIKCVALLKLERYEDALRLIEQSGENLKQKSQLERAYALYKNGDLRQAKEIARNITNRGARHVEAQAVCALRLCGCWKSTNPAH
jgi:signal recognition particle subunit SRP72